MNKIVIITGVTSFLGSSVAKYLISRGYVVFGIVRPESKNIKKIRSIKGLKLLKINFENIDISDLIDVKNNNIIKLINSIKLKNCDITLIHFGWGNSFDRQNMSEQLKHIDYSRKVYEFARLMCVSRFIFAGSQAEYSDSPYGICKKEFSQYIENDKRIDKPKFIHLRIFSIYGPNDKKTTLISTLIQLINKCKDIALGSCSYLWNYLYIDDFTKIIESLLSLNENITFDVASDDTRTLKEYVIEAYNRLDGRVKLNFGDRIDSNEKFAVPDIRSLMQIMQTFEFTKFSDGVYKTFEYIKNGK